MAICSLPEYFIDLIRCFVQVAFHGMEKIRLDDYPELRVVWEGKLQNWSFSSLKSLIVKNCNFLSYVIPSHLLNSLSNLEEEEVCNCNSLEVVFDLQDIEEPHTLPQLQLKSTITIEKHDSTASAKIEVCMEQRPSTN